MPKSLYKREREDEAARLGVKTRLRQRALEQFEKARQKEKENSNDDSEKANT
jgi:hypothetical protein